MTRRITAARIRLAARNSLFFAFHVSTRTAVMVFMALIPWVLFCLASNFIQEFYVKSAEIISMFPDVIEKGLFIFGTLGILPLITSEWIKRGISSLRSTTRQFWDYLRSGWFPNDDKLRNEFNFWDENLSFSELSRFSRSSVGSGLCVVAILIVGIVVYHSFPDKGRKYFIGLYIEHQETIASILRVSQVENTVYYIASEQEFPGMLPFSVGARTFFLIPFKSNASLATRSGIKIDDYQAEILKKFVRAIEDCSARDARAHLEVKGFASISPVRSDEEVSRESDAENCEIANQRAESVVEFLLKHSTIHSHSKINLEKKIKKMTTQGRDIYSDYGGRSKEGFKYGNEDGILYDIEFVPWKDFNSMRRFRIVDDGTKDVRRIRSEFFNRVVQIKFLNSNCWSKGSEILTKPTRG